MVVEFWYTKSLFFKLLVGYMQNTDLKITSFKTKLGEMMAIADTSHLYLLEFLDKNNLDNALEHLKLSLNANITKGITAPIESIQTELKAYLKGELINFKTPLKLLGTPFQKQVWQELQRTPYGHTRSYAQQAQALGKPTAYRAVANANGANRLVIVIPCHRIISSKGDLGGYSSGLERKQWLLEHETRIKNS